MTEEEFIKRLPTIRPGDRVIRRGRKRPGKFQSLYHNISERLRGAVRKRWG